MKTVDARFIDARIGEIAAASDLLLRNSDRAEWNAMESNLLYIAAKTNTALARLKAAQQAWVDEMDAH